MEGTAAAALVVVVEVVAADLTEAAVRLEKAPGLRPAPILPPRQLDLP